MRCALAKRPQGSTTNKQKKRLPMSHPRANFEAAIAALVADGAVKSRLRRAFEDHLEELEDADLPSCVRDSFSELHQALHRIGPIGQQNCLRATVQKMSSAEAAKYAHQIVGIYIDLIAASDRAEPLKVVEKSGNSPQYASAQT